MPAGSDEACRKILEILPEARNKVYDVRKIIAAVADRDSSFELKERFGRSVATVLARLNGKSVGFIANNPMFKGGALDPDACQKATSFMVLCDSFNIPIVFLVDVPGFLIGVEGELRGMPGKIINWMNAISLVTRAQDHRHPAEELRPGLHQHGRRPQQRRDRMLAHGGPGLHGSAGLASTSSTD